eukprot:CAMPEP_0174854096 /NCGR_PEP_ID=MMETSP1114-20130205/29964_1 /TAXON_ID=312471 /ORGANISM="Neobodo designis, Strain CCAP 1951/1" /LENGTH=63 /DNA_ID=CAMNT_0016088769 /DNA_START=1 /DNA_END=192 /DNA_ORIENTATION=+
MHDVPRHVQERVERANAHARTNGRGDGEDERGSTGGDSLPEDGGEPAPAATARAKPAPPLEDS